MTDETPSAAPHDDRPTVTPVDVRDYVDFSQEEARRVRVFATPALALDLWCVEPQQSTGVLRYPEADVSYTVIGGRSWFVTEDGEVGLDPMGSLLVPRGVHHGIDNRGTDPLIVLASMASPDELAPSAPVDGVAEAIRVDDDEPGRVSRGLRRLLGRDR